MHQPETRNKATPLAAGGLAARDGEANGKEGGETHDSTMFIGPYLSIIVHHTPDVCLLVRLYNGETEVFPLKTAISPMAKRRAGGRWRKDFAIHLTILWPCGTISP
jgi:hypothetical protein